MDKQQAEAKVEEQQAAGAGEQLAPAAGLSMSDIFNWVTNEIHSLRGEINDLRGEINVLRGEIKELSEKIHSLQKQIWLMWITVGVGFFAGGNPENPILRSVFNLFGVK